jgi:peptidoglycan hydrolase FlgJ
LPNTLPVEIVRSAAPADKAERAPLSRAVPESFVKFEAMVLQTFMQSILPNDTETVYGGGMAGDMWKSMLAQQLGEVMAKRGGIGIAERVLGDHYLKGEEAAPVAGAPPGGPVTEAQGPLSAAAIENMQRNIVKSLGEDLAAASAER